MAPDRWVVLDDQDPAITYTTGTWFLDSGTNENVGNFGPPYLHTLHGTSADGTVTLEFNGTAVEVWGTSILANPTTNPDPNLECFIDNVSIGREPPFQFPENNWKLCGKTGLADGLHQLRIDVKVQSPKQTFWLDQIRYIPSPNMPLDNKMILIENTDLAVQFDASWGALGGTANMTTRANSVAQVDFVGISISWVAFIPTELPHTGAFGTYAVDQGNPVQFTLRGLATNGTVYNQFYFTTPEVNPGRHTVAVRFLGTGETTPLCLDYLYIKNGTFPVPDLNNATSVPGSQPSAGPGVAGNGGTSNGGTSNGGTSDGGGSSGPPVGAILGGVIGGLAFLIVLAAALLFWRRRRRQRGGFVEAYEHNAVPSPFNPTDNHQHQAQNLGNTMVQTRSGSLPSTSSASPVSPVGATQVYPTIFDRVQTSASGKRREAFGREGPTRHPEDYSHPPHAASLNSASSFWPQSLTEGSSAVRLHTDSGVRLNQPPVEDVPPGYTPD